MLCSEQTEIEEVCLAAQRALAYAAKGARLPVDAARLQEWLRRLLELEAKEDDIADEANMRAEGLAEAQETAKEAQDKLDAAGLALENLVSEGQELLERLSEAYTAAREAIDRHPADDDLIDLKNLIDSTRAAWVVTQRGAEKAVEESK